MDENRFVATVGLEQPAEAIRSPESLPRIQQIPTEEEKLAGIIEQSTEKKERPRSTLVRIASFQEIPESERSEQSFSAESLLERPPLAESMEKDPAFASLASQMSAEAVERIRKLPKFEGIDPSVVEARLREESGISVNPDGSLAAFIIPAQVRQEFAKQKPDEFSAYALQERPMIYQRPQDDPAYCELGYVLQTHQKKYRPMTSSNEYSAYTSHEDIALLANKDRAAYENFASTYPEKAMAYWKSDSKLAEVLAKREGEADKVYTGNDGEPDWHEDPLFKGVTDRKFGGDPSEASQIKKFAYFQPEKAKLYAEQEPALQQGLAKREEYFKAEEDRQRSIREALNAETVRQNQEYEALLAAAPNNQAFFRQYEAEHGLTTATQGESKTSMPLDPDTVTDYGLKESQVISQQEPLAVQSENSFQPKDSIKSEGSEQKSYERTAPTLDKTLASGERPNLLSSETAGSNSPQFTEREGVLNLRSFLDSAIQVSRQTENKAVLQKAEAFRNKLAYIGEQELQEAISSLAKGFVESASVGKNTWIFVPGSRSEEYLTVRTLKEVDKMTEQNQEARKHIKFSKNLHQIAESFKSALVPPEQLAILDDFVLSGSRVRGAAEKLINHFAAEGYKPEEIAKFVHIYAVASRKDEDPNRFSIQQGDQKISLGFQSYFGLEPALDEENNPLFFGTELVTGSHASTDYAFENPLDELKEFMRQNGYETDNLPLPEHLKRPYEKNALNSERPNDFVDPQFQADWELIRQKYELL